MSQNRVFSVKVVNDEEKFFQEDFPKTILESCAAK